MNYKSLVRLPGVVGGLMEQTYLCPNLLALCEELAEDDPVRHGWLWCWQADIDWDEVLSGQKPRFQRDSTTGRCSVHCFHDELHH